MRTRISPTLLATSVGHRTGEILGARDFGPYRPCRGFLIAGSGVLLFQGAPMTRTSWSTEELRTLLSAVSHDLRTPLSVITGRASVLRATVREEHQRDLDTIVHEAQRLSRTL